MSAIIWSKRVLFSPLYFCKTCLLLWWRNTSISSPPLSSSAYQVHAVFPRHSQRDQSDHRVQLLQALRGAGPHHHGEECHLFWQLRRSAQDVASVAVGEGHRHPDKPHQASLLLVSGQQPAVSRLSISKGTQKTCKFCENSEILYSFFIC